MMPSTGSRRPTGNALSVSGITNCFRESFTKLDLEIKRNPFISINKVCVRYGAARPGIEAARDFFSGPTKIRHVSRTTRFVATQAQAEPAPYSPLPPRSPITDIEMDASLEEEINNGNMRKTKLVATIGPACCDLACLTALCEKGMNVARLNMSHGSHEWHIDIINKIRQLNEKEGYSVAIMMDTEGGSEVHVSSIDGDIAKVQENDQVTLTIRQGKDLDIDASGIVLQVSFEGFTRDTRPGDILVIDGGMATLQVLKTMGPEVLCEVVDPGLILPRASINIRRDGNLVRSTDAFMPVICAKDWNDIDMAIQQGVDFIAVSFVRSADVLDNLRSYINSKTGKMIQIVSKIEAYESIANLEEIVASSDAVMVARGDLGAQIPVHHVPTVQKHIVDLCRRANKAVIVASQLLESMHTLPTPTRAEVADITEACRQRTDALMLSGESAIGSYPLRSLDVLRTVATRAEQWVRDEKDQGHYNIQQLQLPEVATSTDGRISENLCESAATIADNLDARAIFCFTKRGVMANLLSRMRPNAPIFAFCNTQEVRQQLSMRWGITPFKLDFSNDPETNITRTIMLLRSRDLVSPGDLIVIVSDITSIQPVLGNSKDDGALDEESPSSSTVRSVQVRHIPF